jgi:hypothetical protein
MLLCNDPCEVALLYFGLYSEHFLGTQRKLLKNAEHFLRINIKLEPRMILVYRVHLPARAPIRIQ